PRQTNSGHERILQKILDTTDPAQVALFPPQAVQASPSAGGLPAKSWGTGMASLASRPQRQGLLAQSPKLPSQRGHDHRLVPRPGPDPPGRPSPCVTNFRKPPRYVERMPGGVGGANREEPAYPIESGLHQRDRADSRTKSAHFVNLIWRDALGLLALLLSGSGVSCVKSRLSHINPRPG